MVEPFVIDPYDIDGTRFIRVAGELDGATAPLLAEVLEQCNGTPACVDLGAVTFLDSSGVAVIVDAHKRAAESATDFRVTNAAPNVRRVFTITGLDDLLTLEPA